MHNLSDKNMENNSKHTGDEIDEYELYYGKNALQETNEVTDKQPGPLSHRPAFSSAIPSIALSILFIICTYTPENSPFYDWLWASRETVFTKHEYWRLITAIFTHADSVHLLSNMPLFIFFGFFLYEYFGFILFPALSLLTGVCANITALYFYPDSVRLVGASGMIYGMVSLWLVLYIYHDTDHTMLMRIFRATGFTLIVLFPETYNPTTSYMAHAAGFVIGIILALAVLPIVKVKRRDGQHDPYPSDAK